MQDFGVFLVEIAVERVRQQREEGYSQEHDDAHGQGQLALAAACYAKFASRPDEGREDNVGTPLECLEWPFQDGWKPTTREHDLVRAGALILAELERLKRLKERAQAAPTPRHVFDKLAPRGRFPGLVCRSCGGEELARSNRGVWCCAGCYGQPPAPDLYTPAQLGVAWQDGAELVEEKP